MFHVNQQRRVQGGVSRESFADTEGREQMVENGLGVHAAEQPFERSRGTAEVLGGQFGLRQMLSSLR
jgi:hypothetical protein